MGSTKEPNAPDGDAEQPKSTSPDDVMVEALAEGHSCREAAHVGGVSERTIFRRLDDPAFAAQVERRKDELNTARVSAFRALHSSRIGLAQRADQTLAELLDHDEPSVRLAAAKLLHQGLHTASDLDTELRLAELERHQAQAEADRTDTGWPA